MRPLIAPLVLVTLLLIVFGRAAAETSSVNGPAGSLEIPSDWMSDQSGDSLRAWSPDDDSSRVLIHKVPGEGLWAYLQKAARDRDISDYVRETSGEFTEDARAEHGGFVLGTVPLGSTAERLPDATQYDDLSPNWVAKEGTQVPARYLIVAAFKRGSDLYVFEGESNDVRGESLVLTGIHRSWVLPR